MHRFRPLIALSSLAAVIVVAPMLATVALGADPEVVRPGDTLTAISRRSGVPIERLVDLNDIADPNRIFVGQRLRIVGDAPEAPRATDEDTGTVHTVRRGETLWGIARQYGTSVAAIVAANGITDPSRILGGQRLSIPGVAEPAASSAPAAARSAPKPTARPAVVHTVRRGETLWGIARHYGTSVAAIVAANGITDPSRIFGGQRLRIQGSTESASARPAAAPRMPADMAKAVAARDVVRRTIVQEARRYDVPPKLALAVAWQESSWRQGVVSHAGAVGVMQLLPATAEWVGDAMLRTSVDIHDTRHNVRAGVRLLAHYLDRYDGSIDLVLAAYYQGQTAADRHGVYPVSRPYIASIKALVRLFGG